MKRLALALGFLVAVLVPVTPAAAQAREPRISLAAQTPWLGETGSFDVVVEVDRAPAGAEVEVTVHSILRSRSAFVQSIEGRPRGTRTRLRAPLDSLPTDDAGNRRVSLPVGGGEPGSLPAGLGQGVYPVTVALRSEGEVVDRLVTHLVRLPDDPDLTPLSVAWIQPLGLDPVPGDELGEGRLAELAPVLDALATTGVALTLEATPETLAALPDSDLAPVRRVLDAGAQLPARPYVDVDPDALVAAGLGRDLASQRQAGEDALLAAVGTRGDPRTWTSGRRLGPRALAALRALGITHVALPADTFEPLDDDVIGNKTLTRPFDLAAGGDQVLRAVAVDDGLVGHFGTGDQVLAAHRLLADLAVLFFDSPGTTRGVAVRPPDGWRANDAFLEALLPALESAPLLRTVTLEQFFDTVEPLEDAGAPVRREPVDGGSTERLPAARILDARRATDELAALVGPTVPAVAAARLQVLVAESTDLGSGERRRLLDDVLARRDEVESHITIADRRSFRLTAREGTIPLTLVNENDFPVSIQLVLSSDKLEFTRGDGTDRSRTVERLVLEPGTHTETVPVRVRASGTFQVRASLLAPGGEPIRHGQFTITSSAFSGVGIVLSIGAGVFLLAWWASHWRTVRRDRRLVQVPQ